MSHPARLSMGTVRFGSLLALLTICIALPSAARAGCAGHYVDSRSPATATAHLELLELAGATSLPAGQMPHEPTKPCSGALCSRNPALPLSTVPSAPPQTGGQWRCRCFRAFWRAQSSLIARTPTGTFAPSIIPGRYFTPRALGSIDPHLDDLKCECKPGAPGVAGRCSP